MVFQIESWPHPNHSVFPSLLYSITSNRTSHSHCWHLQTKTDRIKRKVVGEARDLMRKHPDKHDGVSDLLPPGPNENNGHAEQQNFVRFFLEGVWEWNGEGRSDCEESKVCLLHFFFAVSHEFLRPNSSSKLYACSVRALLRHSLSLSLSLAIDSIFDRW